MDKQSESGKTQEGSASSRTGGKRSTRSSGASSNAALLVISIGIFFALHRITALVEGNREYIAQLSSTAGSTTLFSEWCDEIGITRQVQVVRRAGESDEDLSTRLGLMEARELRKHPPK